MASSDLDEAILNFAQKYNKRRDFVTMVCGAEYKHSLKCSTSGLLIEDSDFYALLKEKLLTYGNIGDKINQTSLGCCAEVNASNYIYCKHPIKLNEVILSHAYRPRTMQIRGKCQICKEIFY
jgi:hypothetical protein